MSDYSGVDSLFRGVPAPRGAVFCWVSIELLGIGLHHVGTVNTGRQEAAAGMRGSGQFVMEMETKTNIWVGLHSRVYISSKSDTVEINVPNVGGEGGTSAITEVEMITERYTTDSQCSRLKLLSGAEQAFLVSGSDRKRKHTTLFIRLLSSLQIHKETARKLPGSDSSPPSSVCQIKASHRLVSRFVVSVHSWLNLLRINDLWPPLKVFLINLNSFFDKSTILICVSTEIVVIVCAHYPSQLLNQET